MLEDGGLGRSDPRVRPSEVREPALSEAKCARYEDANTGSSVSAEATAAAGAESISAGMASKPQAQSSQGCEQHELSTCMATIHGGHQAPIIANSTMIAVTRLKWLMIEDNDLPREDHDRQHQHYGQFHYDRTPVLHKDHK